MKFYVKLEDTLDMLYAGYDRHIGRILGFSLGVTPSRFLVFDGRIYSFSTTVLRLNKHLTTKYSKLMSSDRASGYYGSPILSLFMSDAYGFSG